MDKQGSSGTCSIESSITKILQDTGFGVLFLKEGNMKQLGNLAIVCAGKRDLVMQIFDGKVSVHADSEAGGFHRIMAWDDDEEILEVIRELNFGRYDRRSESGKEQL